jgi:hypothetical protein
MDIVKVLAIAGNGMVLLAVIELIRRGRLKERYALLWLAASSVLLVLSVSRGLLEAIARLVGIFYPPSLLFIVAFVFLLLITLHFSAVISGISEKNKRLAQEIAILREEVAALRRGGAAAP